MPFNTNNKIQIVDASGDACDNDSGKLNVNAIITDGTDVALVNSVGQLEVDTGFPVTVYGSTTYLEGVGKAMSVAVLRKDSLSSAVNTNNEFAPLQVNAEGALYTTHGVTGGADGVKTVSTAGTDVVLGGDVACKKVDIQAQTDNTGLIAVGFTGVDATEATGTGVILYAGDTYSLEINNLNLIYIDSTVSGEGVRYTYFT